MAVLVLVWGFLPVLQDSMAGRLGYYHLNAGLSLTPMSLPLCAGYLEMFGVGAEYRSDGRCYTFTAGMVRTAPNYSVGLFLPVLFIGAMVRVGSPSDSTHLYLLGYGGFMAPLTLGLALRSHRHPFWMGMDAYARHGKLQTVPGFGRSEPLLNLTEFWISGALGIRWGMLTVSVPIQHISWWGNDTHKGLALWVGVSITPG